MNLDLQASKCPRVNAVQTLSSKLGRILADYGIEKQTRLPIQSQLESLSPEKVQSIASSLTQMLETLAEAEKQKINPRDPVHFMRLGLSRQGYFCSQEFWNTVNDEDLIEAYTVEHMQLFRNMKFMEICGYSLMEILSYDWPTLFERSQVVTTRMIELMDKCVREEKILKMDTPAHYMKERMALTRQVVKVDFRHVAPLYTGPGKAKGYIISCRAEMVDEVPVNHELRFI